MLRVIVVGLCHTFLDHVLLAKLIMLHDIVVGLRHTILDHVLPAKLITTVV